MEETGRVKNDLGEYNLKVTRPDGECFEILVSNPVINPRTENKIKNENFCSFHFDL